MFHKEGYQIIMTTFVLTAAIAVLAEYNIDLKLLKIGVQLLCSYNAYFGSSIF